MEAILNIGTERFSNSETSCPLDASHQASIRLTVREEMPYEQFLDVSHGGHLGYRNRKILAILNLYVAPVSPHQIRPQSDQVFESRCGFKSFKMGVMAAFLDIGTQRFLQF